MIGLQTKEEVAASLGRAVAALKAHDPTTARRQLEPLASIIRLDVALRLIRDGRHRAARDMLVDLLPDWLPPVDPYEAALRQRDRQLEGAG